MITIQRGNDISILWTIKNISGEAVDFSGCDITFAVRSKLKGAFFVIPISTDAGVIRANVPGNVLPVGNFYLDMEWNKDISGKKVYWRTRTEELIEITDRAVDFKEVVSVTAETAIITQGYVADVNAQVEELERTKLSISDLAQETGASTKTAMSQDAVTKALAGLLPNQRADNTPYISVAINDGDSGQNWETFNRTLDELASMPDPMPYNGDIRYFISEGLRVDVTNRIFDSSEGASRRLTQVVTGNVRLDERLDLALAGDIDQSFWRIYKEGAWSEWKSVNSEGGSGNVDVVQETGSSMTAVMSQNAVTNEFKKRDNFYFTTLDVVSIDDGANVSAEEFEEIIKIQDAIKSQKTIISSIGILASSVVYRRPSYKVSISYIIGNELRMMTALTTLLGVGTWSVKSQDLSNLANNGYNVLIHGEYAHGEGVSSKLAYGGGTIPTDVQQIMTEWYTSSTGYAIAYGPGSHVEGQDCLATGNYAHAEGIKTLAANDGAHAEGTGANAAGIYAHAEGQNTTAYASACHAEGGMCVCNGNYGHVEGFRCTVENTAGHAEGYITYCRANYGHVEGRQTNSIGPCAHAEGYGNKIDRSITITSISNVEGHTSYFKADNISDLKVGACFIIDYIPYVVTDIADGNIYVNRWIEFKKQKYDIIIMYGVAYGNNAHSEGELGSAVGKNAHVSGVSCIAFNDNEVACGHYNYSFWSDDNAKRTLYSIGIGDSETNRKNAYELKENGDLYIYGVGGYTGKNSSEAKTIQKVITEQQQGSGLNDAPSDNNIYGRKNGKWEPISKVYNELYRIPGRLSSISESMEAPELTSVLGPAQDLIGALSSGRPIASQQEPDGVNEIFCYIPISYRYNVDNNTCSFSYIIGTELYAFDIDLSDGYGNITNFKKKDLTA